MVPNMIGAASNGSEASRADVAPVATGETDDIRVYLREASRDSLLTLEQIGDVLKLTRQRVRQLEHEAFIEVRKAGGHLVAEQLLDA